MITARSNSSIRPAGDQAVVVRAVTVIMGVVVGLTFLFGFGNVLSLALRLGVPVWVAPLVAPAVDLSILGLLLGTRHLALAGSSADLLRPARRLLMFASVVTLAMNVADPLVAGEDAAHRVAHQRPISAETLRVRLGIGAARARRLVQAVRAEHHDLVAHDPVEVGTANETAGISTTLVA
jgi:hypothetical protein